MVWALVLIIFGKDDVYGENLSKNLGSHIVGTYATAEMCDNAAYSMWLEHKRKRSSKDYVFIDVNSPIYFCTPVSNQ